MRPRLSRNLAYRLDVAARICAAVIGSYAFSSLLAMALSRLLPLTRSEAVVTGSLIAVLAMPVAVIAIFAARSALRAWAGMVVALGLAALFAFVIGAPR